MPKIFVVYNPKSGGGDQLDGVKEAFDRGGASPEYVPIGARGLRRKLRQACEARGAVVVAVGGDGTINSVAQYVRGTDCKLGIIPAGTLNHFAKTLGIPLDIPEAVQLILRGSNRRVDVGLVNKHVFVNNSSIGFYPRSVLIRDEYHRAVGKWPAAVAGFLKSALRPRHYRVTLLIEGKSRTFRTPFVFVGNNEYQRSQPDIGERTSVDTGLLAVYVVKATSPFAIIRGVAHALFTRKRRTRDFAVYLAQSCTIQTRQHHSMNVACDGEVFVTRTPLRYKSEHKGLRVIAPS
jgi:diacylglycerol kinase family enzyme